MIYMFVFKMERSHYFILYTSQKNAVSFNVNILCRSTTITLQVAASNVENNPKILRLLKLIIYYKI
jgi:hypothetical protein